MTQTTIIMTLRSAVANSGGTSFMPIFAKMPTSDAVTAASKGAETLGAQTMAYSKKSVDDYMAAAKSLTTAKSIQEVFELQTAWAKSTMEGYLAQVNRASETVAASLKETLTPLNARVTAAVETFQSAR